jgi:ribonucleoside-diphosphate reductase alpha chain
MEELAERGSVHGMPGVPDWVQRLFVTAHDISPVWHARMQAAFQRHTDNAVSKTVNFPHEATIEDVREVYMLAYREGCKGVTIYRDGSKSVQVLSTGQTEKKRADAAPGEAATNGAGAQPVTLETLAVGAAVPSSAVQEAESIAAGPVPRLPRERPTAVSGVTHKIRTGNGTMYVTVNFDEAGKPFEVFGNLGKGGGTDSAHIEAISRLVSMALRAGVDTESIVAQLRGITDNPIWDQGILVRSVPDAVALAMSRHVRPDHNLGPISFDDRTMEGAQLRLYKQPGEAIENQELAAAMRCPDCSSSLAYQEGCLTCHGCGFSKCG